ncbi:helix-turn-helix domain-containing protein [Hoeflea prorocentri]|uniref:XRE family transcriptional regulator n=1 Tax=Hoeflea prorocentri TaxID=1922333 RepID=A0A9X3ULP9_9HYPH|nr:XRE family transcriptional regulator [Hoeflea prorocentri]MCY6381336.1 XRE family transcriptional regulator [Hoeflea prorocentri]MDA5399136.1 XRE family transcriptional regulator [Hoeflea prorocentri]
MTSGATDQAEQEKSGNLSADIGRDLRAVRQSKGMTLAEMSERLGRSVGYLSQVERGISVLSTEELRQVAKLFDVPVSWFLVLSDVPEEERGLITRAGLRRMSGEDGEGLSEELLSPDLSGSYEVMRSVFAPGARSSKPHLRMTEETAYMVSGQLDVHIGKRSFTVHAGDCFRFQEEEFYWENNSTKPAVAIWVVSPPIY